MKTTRTVSIAVQAAAVASLAAWAFACGTDLDPNDCHNLNTCVYPDASTDAGEDGEPTGDAQPDGTMSDREAGADADAAMGNDAPGESGDGPAEGGSGCDAGLTNCSGVCVDTQTSPFHCGSCDNVCPGPDSGAGHAICSGEPPACSVGCGTGLHACGASCLPDTDPPSDASDPCVLSDSFGVFVASGGSNSNPGTSAQPFQTITYALAHMGALTRVYVCNAGTFNEAVTVTGSVGIYGGLDCSDLAAWKYASGTTSTVVPPTNHVALTVSNASGAVVVQDVSFTAPTASGTDGNGNGASSIAGWVTGSKNVSFARVVFTAGDGAAAINGGSPASNWFTGNQTGNTPSADTGAAAIACACPDGTTSSTGESGGNGGGSVSGGDTGESTPSATASGGNNGKGGKGGVTCSGGVPGAPGASGAAGACAGSLGKFSASAWQPVPGRSGTDGDPGQGGGGGGGTTTGGGGGGGGCGGCGGAGGLAGSAGGSSFALVVLGSNVVLTSPSLVAGHGQNGGNGSTGQDGQGGGGGGAIGACGGGPGGPGAGGGGGGGGAGGNSVGIAWNGSGTLTVDGSAVSGDLGSAAYFTPGSAGAGGSNAPGGNASTTPYAGQAGDPDPLGYTALFGADGGVAAVKQF